MTSEGKYCDSLANFINFRAISNAVRLKPCYLPRGRFHIQKLASEGSFEVLLDSVYQGDRQDRDFLEVMEILVRCRLELAFIL